MNEEAKQVLNDLLIQVNKLGEILSRTLSSTVE